MKIDHVLLPSEDGKFKKKKYGYNFLPQLLDRKPTEVWGVEKFLRALYHLPSFLLTLRYVKKKEVCRMEAISMPLSRRFLLSSQLRLGMINDSPTSPQEEAKVGEKVGMAAVGIVKANNRSEIKNWSNPGIERHFGELGPCGTLSLANDEAFFVNC